MHSTTKLFLCAAWGIVAGMLSLVVIVSGARYLAEKDLEDRIKARKTVINAFIGLLVIAAACSFVNYLVHGTETSRNSNATAYPGPSRYK